MSQMIRTLILGILSITFFGFLTAFLILWYFSNDLPNYRFLETYKPAVSSKIYNNNGDIAADFAVQKRTFVSIDEIPDFVVNAFLSAEDKNFFNHPGIDAKGITRAVFNNFQNIISGKRLEGASTITQQVAKNFLLTSDVSLNFSSTGID